ncbi:MAG: 4-alpha-glucanotransferase [Clostridia bacterium]|nr:4-alpha-glucanotransferase [Clostridia bacterium]
MERASGILFPVFSLPSPYGIGDMGQCAYDFVDFLQAAGQKYWQLLPIGPTSYGDSPYQSFSSFAGNPYFIDLEALFKRGLITAAEKEAAKRPVGDIDYGEMYETRYPLLKKAFLRAKEKGEEHRAFLDEQHMWLHDYALFMACKSYFGGKAWTAWPEDIRLRYHNAMAYYRDILREDVEFHIFLQKEFYDQWFALRDYAAKRGVRIIGDLPIYVPMDSTDVWAAPELFQLDEKGVPKGVAGVPPDYFNADGQLWGNPLYDWDRMRQDGYAWWMRRMGACAKLFDMTRIDHFRGLASYWAVPYGDETARGGAWIEGPGMDFVEALHRNLPDYPIIAEDLGFLTDDVRRLLSASGYPGMKVLQFAFDSREPSDYLPHTYPRSCVCYTGTHDNTTLQAWFNEAKADDAAYAREYLGLSQEEGYCRGMIRGGMGSVADLFVACMQDYLETGAKTRINTPGTVGKNWRYRMQAGDCSAALAQRIAAMVKLYGR